MQTESLCLKVRESYLILNAKLPDLRGSVCKIQNRCHSEEQSDEESLLLPDINLFYAKMSPFASAQGDTKLICIQA
jgi:hypothetical protein